ncbi:hypothetical protein Dimus_024560, partial [Dionaea muscipula]
MAKKAHVLDDHTTGAHFSNEVINPKDIQSLTRYIGPFINVDRIWSKTSTSSSQFHGNTEGQSTMVEEVNQANQGSSITGRRWKASSGRQNGTRRASKMGAFPGKQMADV